MKRRFEKSLSLILIILIMVEFALTAINNLNIDLKIAYMVDIWNISFLLSWIFMLFYSIYILFSKDSKGFSIFVAIITVIAFSMLTYHAIIMAANYIPYVPKSLTVTNKFLFENGQKVFYTALLSVYIFHLINLLKLNKNKNDKDESEGTLHVEENTSEDIIIPKNDFY